MAMRFLAVLAALPLMLGACGARDDDPGPGGITADESRALNEAESMLDNQVAEPVVEAASEAGNRTP